MPDFSTVSFEVNGRLYRPPASPVVCICLDGSGDQYLDAAMARDLMPHLKEISVRGYRGLARGALPSFTNVNNASLVTGVAPAVHGISGNFFFDPESGEEVMMNSSRYLRAPTILAAASRAGRRVAVVTAKEKLRDILSHGLEGVAFSSERAAQAQKATHGIERVEELTGCSAPEIYSGEASLFVLRAGAALIEKGLADFLYLSLTDYIQHKFAPEEAEALNFYQAIDVELGRILRAGGVVGLTADHGMNAKQTLEGQPNVIYLEERLQDQFGDGFRVILPITDPYVRHHGALGSFAVIHLPPGARAEKVAAWLIGLGGITEVYDQRMAVRKLELPADRIGDLVVLSARDMALGRRPVDHDLSALERGLRSHGGRYEEMVPFLISRALNQEYSRRALGDLRNFDLFDFTVNGGNDA